MDAVVSAPWVPTCPTCLGPLSVALTSSSSSSSSSPLADDDDSVAEEDYGSSSGSSKGAAAAASPPSSSSTLVGSGKSILSRIPRDRVGTFFRSSTKIEALLEELWRAQQEEPGCKAIVFSQVRSAPYRYEYSADCLNSDTYYVRLQHFFCVYFAAAMQFVNMLQLVEHRLTRAGVRTVKLDGGMTVTARDRSIHAFRDE